MTEGIADSEKTIAWHEAREGRGVVCVSREYVMHLCPDLITNLSEIVLFSRRLKKSPRREEKKARAKLIWCESQCHSRKVAGWLQWSEVGYHGVREGRPASQPGLEDERGREASSRDGGQAGGGGPGVNLDGSDRVGRYSEARRRVGERERQGGDG